MGQSSIPALNRNGYSMFWLSSWDNLHSFSTNINEDSLIRNMFYHIVSNKYSSDSYLIQNKLFSFAEKTGNTFIKYLSNKNISEFFKRLNKIPYYLSKIRILKYQQWCVIYFYVYNYTKKDIKKERAKKIKKLYSFHGFFKFQKKSNLFFLKKKFNFYFDF